MIRSENLILRAPELSDLDLLYQWENDSSLWYLSNANAPYSRFLLEQYILNAHQDIFSAKQVRMMIDVQLVGVVGAVDLFDFDPINLRAGVGIVIDKQHREKGYASTAIELVKKYASDILHLKQLYCGITSDNQTSMNLFTKLGFVPCGVKKQWIRKENSWLDEHQFQCIME